MHSRSQLKLLVSLAQVDGRVAEREKNYIINIARANGIYPDEVLPLFETEHDVIVPEGLTPDQKFQCIYNLVHLMKIDERMYQEEIRFCSGIATKLGYDPHVLFELMLQVKTSGMNDKEIEKLKKLTKKFLKK
jgi:hypothetical protein